MGSGPPFYHCNMDPSLLARQEQMRQACLMLILLLPLNLTSQVPDLFSLQYAHYPSSPLQGSYDSVDVRFAEASLAFLVPVQRNERLTTLVGAGYSMVFPASDANALDTRLYFIGLQAVTSYRIDERRRLGALLLPAISSTLQDPLAWDDLLTQASMMYTFDRSERLRLGVGAVYTSRFGYPLLLPMVSLRDSTDEHTYELVLPLGLRASWKAGDRWSYGLALTVNGSQYDPARDASFNGLPVDAVHFSRILLGPELKYRLRGPLWLSVSAGVVTRRIFDLRSERAADQDLGVQNGMFVATRLYIPAKQPT